MSKSDPSEKVELIAAFCAENQQGTSILIKPRGTQRKIWIGKSIIEDQGAAPGDGKLYNLFLVPWWWMRANELLDVEECQGSKVE